MPHFRIKPVESEEEWAAARAIRRRVFIEEQNCPEEEEWDGFDESSRHLLGLLDELPVATARWRTVPHGEELVAKLERFAVLPDYRGRGYGRRLVRRAMEDARSAGFATLCLHAQVHLEDFYAGFGFQTEGERFMEAGIPHVSMVRREESRGTGEVSA